MTELTKRLNPERTKMSKIEEDSKLLTMYCNMLTVNGGAVAVDEKYDKMKKYIHEAKKEIIRGEYSKANKIYQNFAKYVFTDELMIEIAEKTKRDPDAIRGENPYMLGELALKISSQLRKIMK